jgi:hypothetical protein
MIGIMWWECLSLKVAASIGKLTERDDG